VCKLEVEVEREHSDGNWRSKLGRPKLFIITLDPSNSHELLRFTFPPVFSMCFGVASCERFGYGSFGHSSPAGTANHGPG
jgi:hypothetical protein